MDRTQNKQAGFNIVEILLIIVAVGVIGVGGWFVYQHNRTRVSDAAGSNQTTQQTTTTTPAPTVAYLTIIEWGVKLPLSAEVKDAYYMPAVGSSKGTDGQPNTLLLGLRSQDSNNCAATNNLTALAQISRTSPSSVDPVTNKLYTQEYPNGVILGDYFYAYQGISNSDGCKVPQASAQPINDAFNAAVKGIVSTTAN